MKNVAATILTAAILPLLSSLAWAAPGVREDDSTLVIWAFLGFCAVIVVAQVIPSVRDSRRAAAEERAREAAAGAIKPTVEE